MNDIKVLVWLDPISLHVLIHLLNSAKLLLTKGFWMGENNLRTKSMILNYCSNGIFYMLMNSSKLSLPWCNLEHFIFTTLLKLPFLIKPSSSTTPPYSNTLPSSSTPPQLPSTISMTFYDSSTPSTTFQ